MSAAARAASLALALTAALAATVPRAALAAPTCVARVTHACCARAADDDAVGKPPCTCCVKQAPAPTTSGVLAPDTAAASPTPALFAEPTPRIEGLVVARLALTPDATGPPLRSRLRTVVLLL